MISTWVKRKGMEMLKKILVGALVVAMVSLLVFGFVRAFGTSADAHGGSANLSSVARGQGGRGAGAGNEEHAPNAQGGGYGRGQGQGLGAGNGDRAPNAQGGGYGRGQGQGPGQGQSRGQGQGGQESSRQEPQAEIADWQTVEGIVVETDELVIQLDSGKNLQIGLGPSHYRDSQGFALSAGERVQVDGYLEDGEFKAAKVVKLDSGESIVLRDPSGRPMWAGRGRRSGSSTL
jgi:hypothetical protein